MMSTALAASPSSPTLDALSDVRAQLSDLASSIASARPDAAPVLHSVSASGTPAASHRPHAPSAPDAVELVEAISAVEGLKNILDALQSGYEIALRNERIKTQRAAGLPASKLGSGTGDEIALARGISPSRAGNQLALRRVIVETLPRIWERMAEGAVSGWAAEEVARAVIVLDDEDRQQIDAELAPTLHQVSPRTAGRKARARADALDQEAAVARLQRNVGQRHVSQRPAAEGMMRLSALLPLHEGVAAYASLSAAADAARAEGDGRSRGQVMADALTARVTGQEQAVAPVEIQLLMTDRTLLAGGDDTAQLEGHPIPGPVARHLALTGRLFPEPEAAEDATPPGAAHTPSAPLASTATPPSDSGPGSAPSPAPVPAPAPASDSEPPPSEVRRWIRRLYADPVTGELTSMDTRKRLFTGHMRRFVLARERQCRTPGCEAASRHVHHIKGRARGGTTTLENGAGLCERFNYVVELPGWSTSRDAASGDLVITTPTGHHHRSPIPNQWEAVGIHGQAITPSDQPPGPTSDPPPRPPGDPVPTPARFIRRE